MKLWFRVTLLLLPSCFGCRDEATPPPPLPPYVPTIQLSMEDVSCTEAWLRVSLTDAAEPRTVAIQQDGQRVLTARMTSLDSLLVVEGLLPRRTYTFLAQRLRDSTVIDASATVQATTMDTTSNNWVFEIDTLGDAYSMLSDVAIINDTLAYAVGEMYLRDSTGQMDPHRYNLAVWNGSRWDIRRLNYSGIPPAIRFVFAVNENDVWFDPWFHWDGQSIAEVPIDPIFYGVGWNKMWGTQSGGLYVVGEDGNIAYLPTRGASWQRVVTGTTSSFRDIWGARNRSGQMEILALASEYTVQTQDVSILQLSGGTATPVSVTGLAPDMSGIWFAPGKKYYAVGAGVHRKHSLSDSAWVVYPPGVVTRSYSSGTRGTNVNDVLIAGAFGEVVHFNGVNWHRYFGSVPIPGGALGPMAVTERLAMAVGHLNANRGLVLIGRR